ncbi:phage tail protein [Convivina intestini]|uniref:phage tail protein n=1 Tax=Convivina intestini TaxID=1505726 RepID=UPI00200C25A6|nr:phage tail protein [Convivina intestini]CAH1857506.1 hypothetical protein R077811_01540 [Convivina intestini]
MATLGITNAWVAKVDATTFKVITGVDGINGSASDTDGKFLINETSSKGIASFNMTNLQGATTDIYGSNKVVYKSSAKGNVQGVLTVNNLPAAIKERLIGDEHDGRGGYKIDGKANSNNLIAILVESSDSFDENKKLYVGLYGSVVTEASKNMQTNNASEQRTTDALTFSPVERGDDGFGKNYYGWADNFDEAKMFNDIFPTTAVVNSGTNTTPITPAGH